MKRRMVLSLCGLLLAFPAALVCGLSVTANAPITVSEARNLPHDSWVVLQGSIINALPGGRNHTFRDASGDTIIVEIDLNIWRGLTVAVADTVMVGGELRTNRGQLSVRARFITGSGGTNPRAGQAVTVNQPVPVAQALNLPHDSWVVLRGNIINALPGGRNYIFSDAAGQTTLIDIEQRIWRGLSVGVDDNVQISGEVRINRGQVSIRVRAISITP